MPAPKRDEEQRLKVLQRYGLLDTPPEPDYDDIVQLISELCEVPIALISLVDRDRQWFKANAGLSGLTETDRWISFCTHAIEQEGVFLVEDALADARFAHNPLVRGQPLIRFYAGAPLQSEEGFNLGTLCVIDRRPRTLTERQLQALVRLGRQVEAQFHLRLQLREARARNAELEGARARLHELNESLRAEVGERQRAERELTEQKELLTSVITHIPHAVFWKDRHSVYLGCNGQFARDVGASSPADIVSRLDFDLGFPPEQAEAYRQDDRQVMDSGVPKLDFEEPLRAHGGEERWLLTSKVPLRDAAGMVRGVLGIYTDITERRRQQFALQEAKLLVELHAARLELQVQEAHERTRTLMEASGDAVFLLDEEGRIQEVNPVAERLLGTEGRRLLGAPFEALAPESEREPLRQGLQDLLVRGTVRLEQGLRSTTGERVVLDLVGSLQVAGALRYLLVVGHDLTEKRRLEQQSIQNDRLASMGALAAGITHEINNPTAFVLSNLDYLRRWRDDLERELRAWPDCPPQVLEQLEEAREVIIESWNGCSRIRDIARDMRFFSHTPDESLVPVDVHASLDVVLRMAHAELKYTARLEKDYARELPAVLGSEGRLSQVFLNLIVNAIHAMRPGSLERHVLRIRTARDGERVRVDISDTGHGIAPEVLPRIFDPFFTTKPAGSGSGLGLSISYSLIQKMGGQMRVESEPGRGTTFSLLLLACGGQAGSPREPRASSAA